MGKTISVAEKEGKKLPQKTSHQVSATEKQGYSYMHSSPLVELECILCLYFLYSSLTRSWNDSAANTERVSCFMNCSDLGKSVYFRCVSSTECVDQLCTIPEICSVHPKDAVVGST